MSDEKLEQILMALAVGAAGAKILEMEEWQIQIEEASKLIREERNEQFKKSLQLV